jgi:predicted  nucleic acid-binding Zn-ribbon protein
MAQTATAAVSFIGANVAAAVVSAQANDYGFSAIVGGITLAITATCTMIVVVSPLIAKSIREGFPPIITALNELRRQFEEARKSTYTGQIDELKEMVTDLKQDLADARDREARLAESLDKARKSLHEIRDKQNEDILTRDAKILELEDEVKALRAEIARLTQLHEARVDAQDRKIEENAATLDKIIQAGSAAADALHDTKPESAA